MIIIVELNRIFIEEYGPSLQEGDAVLLQIRTAFRLIPLERYHTYSVCTVVDLSIWGPNAQFSGAEHEVAFWATMLKTCPKRCGVFGVRWNDEMDSSCFFGIQVPSWQ